jgi:hypothetical protein
MCVTASRREVLQNVNEQENILEMMTIFWDLVPCSVVEVYQCFSSACCLHHHGAQMIETLYTKQRLTEDPHCFIPFLQ